jgi:hypothetical protein
VLGIVGHNVSSLLGLVHGKTGPLPEFHPIHDIQRGMEWLTGTEIHPGVAWLLGFVNGAVICGFVFGQAYRSLPGNNPRQKGVFFSPSAPGLQRGLYSSRSLPFA